MLQQRYSSVSSLASKSLWRPGRHENIVCLRHAQGLHCCTSVQSSHLHTLTDKGVLLGAEWGQLGSGAPGLHPK
jgi:hypothetical protein